ncbi:MAG: hypothetical protein K2G55_11340 [Lachnospiraceae bacterium]|nr:hypothetical protein [Lachnospiraceae bacterium]MDE7202010.1 hypothetical protein [Lachnospiraceae bacterium]
MMKKRVVFVFIAVMVMGINMTACEKAEDGMAEESQSEQIVIIEADIPIVEQDRIGETRETALNEEQNDTEKATSGEDLDVVVPNTADDDWYKKGTIYIDDHGNQLEVFFNDEGVIEFAVNGLSMYFTRADDFQMENNWKVYICDDGTVIIYYPGEPAHLEISDGDYAGLFSPLM